MKKNTMLSILPAVFAFFIVSLFALPAHSQSPFVSGLQLPSKIIFTPRGHLLVAENGSGPNAGRISVVDRNTGFRRTLISGLPAGIASAEGDPAPSGPAGLFLSGNTLYVVIAEGDGVLPGPVPGSQQANPSPASPLLSSLLKFTFNAPIDSVSGEISLTALDQLNLKAGQSVVLGNATQATAKLVADFPNSRNAPRPDFPLNVEHSDPYGVAVLGNFAYVNDAGQNTIRKVNLTTGEVTTLTEFADVPNTTGVGGPVIEAVPDSIRLDGDRLLVTLLSGFPFAPGFSKVVAVDPSSGAITPIIDGLTTAIDVVPLSTSTATQYVVAEFSSNLVAGDPGRILLASTTGEKTTLAGGIVSPSSIAVDTQTGEVFVAQIFPGHLLRLQLADSLPTPVPSSIIPVVASVPGSFGSRFETSLQLTNPYDYTISGTLRIRTASGVGTLDYQLAPHETRSYGNLMSAAGLSGIGSVDIEAGVGSAPLVVARIFDTTRNTAATGAIISQLSPDDALREGEQGVLVTTSDPATSRTNVGVRSLGEGATLKFSLYRAEGTVAGTVEKTYGPNVLAQESAADLFGVAAADSDSIVVEVVSGSALVYTSTINNVTQETSWNPAVRVSQSPALRTARRPSL